MSLHTYLSLHEAKQNVVRQRLIGSQLVSSVCFVSIGSNKNTMVPLFDSELLEDTFFGN